MEMEQLTEDEGFALDMWSRWGSDGYPLNKRKGKWFIDGIRGCGVFPIACKTKKEASGYWEGYIDSLIDRKAGRRAAS